MFAYIVRRLLWALILLFLLSVVTFSIFYLVPRWAGATPETLATRYVGRSATEETVQLTAERLGFNDPIYVQYWDWLKGVFFGATYNLGTGPEQCPAPCFGYSFIGRTPVRLVHRSQSRPRASSRRTVFWILPVDVLGSGWNTTRRGTL